MRLCSVVLATAIVLLASSNAAIASTETKLAAVVAAGTPLKVGVDNRLLRTEGTTEDDFPELLADDEERDSSSQSFWEKTKFYYWYKMGDTPAELYQKFFKGVDRAIVVKNPNYKVYERYKAYYNKETKSA